MLYSRVMRTVAVAAVFLVLPAQARAESLREALAAAYMHHPSITSAVLAVQSAAESIAQRAAGTRPTIGISASVGASATTTIGGTTIPGAPNPSQTLSSSVGLNYSHRLFDNLSTDAAVGQAQALVEVARQALRNAEQNVLLQAATAYLNVVRDTRLVQLRQENVNFLQAQVRSSRDRLEIGEGTRIEVSQSEARLAQAVASFQSAVASLQISRASYARWVGHAPQNLSLDFRFVGILPPSLDEALRLGETQHPAILTAQAQIMAAQFGTDAARAAFGPTLDLIGSIGGAYSGTSALGTLPGAVSPTATASVRLSLSIPIYAGGAMGSAMRQANIGLAKSEFDALSTRDQIIEAVIAAWAGVQNASAQIESARTAVASGQLALDGVIEERDVGQSTTLAVLNARADLTTIQEGLISAQSSRLIAAFSLASATGTLSAADLQLPVETVSADGYVSTVQDIWQELRAVPE